MQAFESVIPKTSFNRNGQEHSSCLALRLDKAGHILTQPVSYLLTGFARVFLIDLKPGWWGQMNSAACELIYRTCLIILGIALLPLAMVGTVLGAPLRAMASLSKKDFIYHKCTANTEKVLEHRALSFNTLLMPEFITRRNNHRPTMERVYEIAHALIRSKRSIICLQEVFHTEAAEILDNELHRQGYSIVRNIGHQILGLNSGLFLASKYPLSNLAFYEFPPLKAGADRFANKGLLLATAKINGKNIVIGNTHLNGGGNDDTPGYVCRAAQTLAVAAYVRKYIANRVAEGMKIDGGYICADTNIGPTYYEGRDDSGALKPTIESEWLLSRQLHEKQNTPIPSGKDVFKKRAWKIFSKKVKEHHQAVSKKSRTMNFLDFVKEGGAFPPQLFKHDLQSATLAAIALKGSTIDMNFNPQVGWGKAIAVQPERVDFISAISSVQTKELRNIRLRPMLSQEGRLCSDHLAVTADILS
jgi:hypothetical protein